MTAMGGSLALGFDGEDFAEGHFISALGGRSRSFTGLVLVMGRENSSGVSWHMLLT